MPFIDFWAVRQQLSLIEVLADLGWHQNSLPGSLPRGPCPIHGSRPKSKSFAVKFQGKVWHCFGCGKSGGALDLWVLVTGLSYYEAAVELCQRQGIPLPVRRGTEEGNASMTSTRPDRKAGG